jgi:hypothetical protein
MPLGPCSIRSSISRLVRPQPETCRMWVTFFLRYPSNKQHFVDSFTLESAIVVSRVITPHLYRSDYISLRNVDSL